MLTIAAGPLLFPKLWRGHYAKTACGWSALTYVGNALNFLVYVIATERGVGMPSFFGYVVWSRLVLAPALAVVTFVSASVL